MACHPEKIKGTSVPYTEKNKAVVRVVQQYSYRFKNKQWDKLLQLVSTKFVERGGSPDAKDDYGYATLRKKMYNPSMQKVRIIRLKVHVDEIKYPVPTEAHVYVRKQYTFLYPRGKYRPGLKVGSMRQKMVLEYAKGKWLFVRW